MSMNSIAKRFFDEVWGAANVDLVDQLFGVDYVGHPSGPESPVRGPESVKQYVSNILTAFPDLTMKIEDQVSAGDTVVTRWVAQGTHRGELMGLDPTERQGTVTGITIQRLRKGKIVEGWTSWDLFGLLQQLGVPSQPAQR
jgi:steroid delta-isomerase-like uncharacterized protein